MGAAYEAAGRVCCWDWGDVDVRAGTVGREGAGRAERWRGMVIVVVISVEVLDCRVCCCLEDESETRKGREGKLGEDEVPKSGAGRRKNWLT